MISASDRRTAESRYLNAAIFNAHRFVQQLHAVLYGVEFGLHRHFSGVHVGLDERFDRTDERLVKRVRSIEIEKPLPGPGLLGRIQCFGMEPATVSLKPHSVTMRRAISVALRKSSLAPVVI